MQYSDVSEWPMAEAGAGALKEVEENSKYGSGTRSNLKTRGRRGRPRKQTATWDNNAMMQALETLARMLTPQVMLPVQLKSEPEDLPEFGLLRAVLLSAVVEYVDSFKPSPNPDVAQRRRESRRVAESWFAGDPGAPIDFELCCAMYGVSADTMRAKIKQLTKRLSAPWN
jgi:hypothetical protein